MGSQIQPLVMEVEKRYGLKVSDIKKNPRGWILECDGGPVFLKSTNASEAALIFCDSIYDHMDDQGFDHLLPPYKTKEGKSYFPFEHGLVQGFDDGSLHTISFKNSKDVADVVGIMAKFHQKSHGFKSIPGSKVKTQWGRWIWEFQSYCRLAKKMRENLQDKRNKEKMEKIFLETFDEYYGVGMESIEILKKTNYLERVKASMEKNELCIHNFNEKNFFSDGNGKVVIGSLEDAKHDICAIDVADCMLQHMDHWEVIKAIPQIYDEINPLKEDELDIIKAYVQFPHEYFKVMDKYYKNKKDVTGSYWYKKMKKAIKLEGLKKDFYGCSLKEVVNKGDGTGRNQ